MKHDLIIREWFADAIIVGDKTFEVRYNDRCYQKGDVVSFTVVDELNLSIRHPIQGKIYEIIYVLSGRGIQENYCVFGIRELDEGRAKSNE